ncbi:MAG: IS4 family transposase [Verrucomicrobiaceae bacterium]|nr:IS4 family transposase [Verrucomicrobiaceae bacterium]
MALSTCFLPHFPRALQGRAKNSAASRIVNELQKLRDLALPDLAALLGGLLPADFFAKAPDAKAQRERLYPPVTLFWAFLFQVLNPAMPCQEVVGKVRAWVISRGEKRRKPSLGTAAYCEARCGLSLRLPQAVFDELREHLQRRAASAWLWCGHHVKVLDGTSFSMPDTGDNQLQWPQPCTQKKGCGFPVAKMLGLFCLSTGAWLGHALSKWKAHDLGLWHLISHLLVKGDVLVGDAGFCAYALMAELKGRGIHTVFRLHQKRPKDMRRGKKLGRDDRLQDWHKPAQRPAGSPWKKRAWNKLPASLEVRVVRVKIERKGFRTRCLWIATTCTDAVRYPAEKLAELYYRRWSIELFYRDIKTTMHMEVMRTKTPDMVRKELLMHAIAYNMIRAMILQSASQHQQELGRISFKGAVDMLRQWLPQAAACHEQPRKLARWHEELLEAIASVQNPLRPGRREPRAKKRRPKSYQLLTAPRHQFQEIPHRERYRAVA